MEINICNANLNDVEIKIKEELIAKVLKLKEGFYKRKHVEAAIKTCCSIDYTANFECVSQNTERHYLNDKMS